MMNKQDPKKKRKKWPIVLASVGAVIVVVAVIVIAFFPNLFSPKDLGVKTSQSDLDSASSKLDGFFSNADKAEKSMMSTAAPTVVETTLSSEEITSYLEHNAPSDFPIKGLQVRVNEDDTVDLSGSIDKNLFLEYVISDSYTEEDLKKEVPVLDVIPQKINLFASISGEVDKNYTEIDLEDLEVMGFNLPDTVYSKAEISKLISDGIDSYINSGKFANVEFIKVKDSNLLIKALTY